MITLFYNWVSTEKQKRLVYALEHLFAMIKVNKFNQENSSVYKVGPV